MDRGLKGKLWVEVNKWGVEVNKISILYMYISKENIKGLW